MPRVVLLVPTSSYRTNDFITAARALGVELIVASDQPPSLPDPGGVRSLVVDFNDPAKAADLIVGLDNRQGVDGVVALDDQGIEIAALTADRLGLRSSSPAAVSHTRDKASLRTALAKREVSQPRFAAFDDPEEIPAIGFPCVIKPVGLSASQGVIRANNHDEATRAAKWAQKIAGGGKMIVEEYVSGSEVAVEGLLRDGNLETLVIFDKPDLMEGPYFEETIYVTPSRHKPKIIEMVKSTSAEACRAINLTEGPVHIELRISGDRCWVIEVAARSIGGLCARTLSFSTGVSWEEIILRHALEMPIDFTREKSAAGVMMIPIVKSGALTGVKGKDDALRSDNIVGVEITVPIGRSIKTLPEGDRYLGFIFARAQTPAEVEQALRLAHAKLKIEIT